MQVLHLYIHGNLLKTVLYGSHCLYQEDHQDLKLGLCSLKSDRGIESTVSDLSCGSSLTEFNPVSPDKLSQLLGGSGLKVCSLDPLPSLLMKNCVDVLLPIVTNIVNCSLDAYTLKGIIRS